MQNLSSNWVLHYLLNFRFIEFQTIPLLDSFIDRNTNGYKELDKVNQGACENHCYEKGPELISVLELPVVISKDQQ